MGIPGFFRQIERSHSDVIVPKLPTTIDHLLWDFNSILYNALHHVNVNLQLVQWDSVSNEILKIVQQEINNTMKTYKPKKTLYIAIDGTTPIQKLAESRARRSQRYLETIWWPYLQNSANVWYPMRTNRLPFILESFGSQIPTNEHAFTSLEFTPGSKFYSILYKDLAKFLPKMNKKWNIPEVILDGPFTPGEAEQKFLHWVRQEIPETSTDSTYILSKDADLLVLPFALYPRKFYVLREIDDERKYQELWGFQDVPQYAIVKLPELYKRYLKTIDESSNRSSKGEMGFSLNPRFYDQLALTFFQGNDFVKPIWYLPSFWNQSEGIIQEIYQKTGELLTGFDVKRQRWTFSLPVLKQFFTLLATQEVQNSKEYALYLLKQGNPRGNREEESPLFSEWITHLPFTHPAHPWKKPMLDFLQKLVKSANHYSLSYWSHEDSKMIQDQIHPSHPGMPSVITYLQSLQWTFEYYMNHGTNASKTLFEQPVSPFPSQIVAELNKLNSKNQEWLTDILPAMEESQPLTPLEAFISVLPVLPNFPGKDYLPKSLHKDWETYVTSMPFADVVMPRDPKEAPCDVITGHKWSNKNLLLHLPAWDWEERIRLIQKHSSEKDIKERNLELVPAKFLAGK